MRPTVPRSSPADREALRTEAHPQLGNDTFRRSFTDGRVVLTAEVAALPEAARAAVLAAVRGFEAFDSGNEPHGEHDFGAVEIGGLRCFWKIDAYDWALAFTSPGPPDPAVTDPAAHRHASRGILS